MQGVGEILYLLNDFLPRLSGTLRFINADTASDPVDIYAGGKPIAMNLAFGDITEYEDLPAGKSEIQIYKAGTLTNPILTETIEIVPDTIVTISMVLRNGRLQLFTLRDGIPTTSTSQSYLRFINLSPDSPLLSLSLPTGDTLFRAVEYLETTGYYPLSVGIYDFEVEATLAGILKKTINNIKLEAGYFHTLFIIGLIDGTPKVGYLFEQDGRKH